MIQREAQALPARLDERTTEDTESDFNCCHPDRSDRSERSGGTCTFHSWVHQFGMALAARLPAALGNPRIHALLQNIHRQRARIQHFIMEGANIELRPQFLLR